MASGFLNLWGSFTSYSSSSLLTVDQNMDGQSFFQNQERKEEISPKGRRITTGDNEPSCFLSVYFGNGTNSNSWNHSLLVLPYYALQSGQARSSFGFRRQQQQLPTKHVEATRFLILCFWILPVAMHCDFIRALCEIQDQTSQATAAQSSKQKATTITMSVNGWGT